MHQVIVLNGGSSSGKTTIAARLQELLPDDWQRLGIDDLADALPADAGIAFGEHGEVEIDERFRELEAAWMSGIGAMARAGARVIVDDVFLAGRSQERPPQLVGGLALGRRPLRPSVATPARPHGRPDRGHGGLQATIVPRRRLELEVTDVNRAIECARLAAGVT